MVQAKQQIHTTSSSKAEKSDGIEEDKSSTTSPPSRLRFSVVLSGFVIGLLAVYLVLSYFYVWKTPVTPLVAPPPSASGTAPAISQGTPPAREAPEPRKLEPLNHTFSFEEVFERLRAIDKSRKTDFRKESLHANVLPLARISAVLGDVKKLNDDLNRSVIANETIYWIHLIEGRMEQLESERYLHLAAAYGRRGLLSKNLTESCTRKQDILDASLLYNQSARHGGRAMNHFDETLTQEKTWLLLGINENKMAFFGGDTRDIGYLAYRQVEKIRTQCMGLASGDIPRMLKTLDTTHTDDQNQSQGPHQPSPPS